MADPIIRLSGLLNSIRICGFNIDYAQFIIRQLFELPIDDTILDAEKKGFPVSKMSPWPRMKGQTSFIDIGKGKGKHEIVLDNHDIPAPIAEHEKMPVSYFDADFYEPDEPTFKQRSTSLTAKLIKSIKGDRKEKAEDAPKPATSGEDKAPKEAEAAKKQRTSHVRRSLSLGSVSRPSSPGEELAKTVSLVSLRKQVSNFTLRSKSSKKSLNTSTGEDSETLIPDVPPIPQYYKDAGYARSNLTESTTKYEPAVKATKDETEGLLERPKTPTVQPSPKKPTETPSRLKLFRKTPKERVSAEAMHLPPKTPAKKTASALPKAPPKRPARPDFGIEDTLSGHMQPRVIKRPDLLKSKKPDGKTAIKAAPIPAPGPSQSTASVTAEQLSKPFQTRSTGSMPPTSSAVISNLVMPRLRPQRSNIAQKSTMTPHRNELAVPRMRTQQATSPTRNELAVTKTRNQQAMPSSVRKELAVPKTRSKPTSPAEQSQFSALNSTVSTIPVPMRMGIAPSSTSSISQPSPTPNGSGLRQTGSFPHRAAPARQQTHTHESILHPSPLRTVRSQAGLITEWMASQSSGPRGTSTERRPPIAAKIAIRSRFPVRPSTPVPQRSGQQETVDFFDPDRSQYDIVLSPMANQISPAPERADAGRVGHIPQPGSEPSLATSHRQYQERIMPSQNPFSRSFQRIDVEQNANQTVTEKDRNELF